MNTSLRPSRFAKAVNTATAEELWPKIEKWLSVDERTTEELRGLKTVFSRYLEYISNTDAYYLSKMFDDWEPNEEFVEIMSEFEEISRHKHEDAVRKWVTDNQIKPRLLIGEHVHCVSARSYQPKTVNGAIIDIDETIAIYKVYKSQTSTVMIPYEDAEPKELAWTPKQD